VNDAAERRDRCEAEIRDALRRHGAKIETILSIEPVGEGLSRGLIEARWRIVIVP